MIGMSAGGVHDVLAARGAAIGGYSGDAPVLGGDCLDAGGSDETDTQLAALVLVRLNQRAWGQVPVRRAPEHRSRLSEIHQRPATFGVLGVNEARLESGRVSHLLERAKFLGPFFTQRDAQRTDFAPVGFNLGPLEFAKSGHRMHGEFGALDRVADLAAEARALRRGDLADILGAL